MPIFHSDALNNPLRDWMTEELKTMEPYFNNKGYNWIDWTFLESCSGCCFMEEYSRLVQFYAELKEHERASTEQWKMLDEDFDAEVLYIFPPIERVLRFSPEYRPVSDWTSSDSELEFNIDE